MRKLYILSRYKGGSLTALRKALGRDLCKVINPYEEAPKGKGIFLNWGTRAEHSHNMDHIRGPIVNSQRAVARAINKLSTLKRLAEKNIPCLEFTDDFAKVREWLAGGRSVFGRRLLEASSGKGIVLANYRQYRESTRPSSTTLPWPTEFPECKLWTRNFPKTTEMRVHVFAGRVIAFAEKRQVNKERLKTDPIFNNKLDKPDFWVRNHENGWVYCTDGVKLPSKAEQVSLDAVRALELDFGAVDLLIGEQDQVAVCEVNTAPGLEGITLDRYANSIRQIMETV